MQTLEINHNYQNRREISLKVLDAQNANIFNHILYLYNLFVTSQRNSEKNSYVLMHRPSSFFALSDFQDFFDGKYFGCYYL